MAIDGVGVPYAVLAARLGLSASEVHAALKRLTRARLVNPERRVVPRNLLELVLHGVKYAWPAAPGGPVLGVPTGPSAPMLRGILPATDPPWVWPWAAGTERGYAIEPLYPSAPGAALRDAKLYELLALVDALRAGQARDRAIAERRLTELLSGHEG